MPKQNIYVYTSRFLDQTQQGRHSSTVFYYFYPFAVGYKRSQKAQYPLPLTKYTQGILVLIYLEH